MGLTATDEAYDITSYVNSSLFDVSQVMGTSSSRDGKASVFYGLERLSQVTEGATSAFIHDGRGSVAQTILGGAVTSWKRYGAFGAVTAGTDAREKPFFGYDAEEQDPLTGLTYLRARYYDPGSARFGVADTYLGNTFDPITLNRYLYCASDPVNHVDPTGHRIKNALASGIGRIIGKMTPTGGTPINGNSFANLPGQMTIDSTLISPNASDAEKWAQAQHNTNRWLAAQALKRGDTASAAYHAAKAAQYREQFTKLYCGTAERMRAVGNAMIEWSYTYGWIPIVGTVVEWNGYVAKGDVGMTALFSVLSLIEVLSAGGVSKVETTGKLALGAGAKEMIRNTFIPKAIVGGEVTIGETTIKNSADAARLIVNAERKGSAIKMSKADDFHRAGLFLDEGYLSKGTVFSNDGGTGILLQVEGEVNGHKGIFEYALEADGAVSHQFFVKGGVITGKTNQKVGNN